MADFAGAAGEDMIQALGWFGSALVVASLALHQPVRFRVVNLASAVVLLTFNLAIGLWSMVVLNVAILAVNAWHLRKLVRSSPAFGPAASEEGWFIQPAGFTSPRPTDDSHRTRPSRARVDQNAASTR